MKRLFWMAAGAALTTVGSRWTKRTASRVAEQYAPVAVGRRVATNVGQRVQDARREGRAAMADTESRLRARLTGTEGPEAQRADEGFVPRPAPPVERTDPVRSGRDAAG